MAILRRGRPVDANLLGKFVVDLATGATDEVTAGGAVVNLYFDAEQEAQDTAEDARGEGLSATVERPATGNEWAVTVEGERAAVLAFAKRPNRAVADPE